MQQAGGIKAGLDGQRPVQRLERSRVVTDVARQSGPGVVQLAQVGGGVEVLVIGGQVGRPGLDRVVDLVQVGGNAAGRRTGLSTTLQRHSPPAWVAPVAAG